MTLSWLAIKPFLTLLQEGQSQAQGCPSSPPGSQFSWAQSIASFERPHGGESPASTVSVSCVTPAGDSSLRAGHTGNPGRGVWALAMAFIGLSWTEATKEEK